MDKEKKKNVSGIFGSPVDRLPSPVRYSVAVATVDTDSGFIAAWTYTDLKTGMSYSYRRAIDDPSLPRIASALVLAVRQLSSYPKGRAMVFVPRTKGSDGIGTLYSLWRDGDPAFRACEDSCYWEEVFDTLGPDVPFVTYLDETLPAVSRCVKVLAG